VCYGFKVPEVRYDAWRERYVSAGGQEKNQEQHALVPLYHFCINDLPATMRAPKLDGRSAVKILNAGAENWTGIDESAGYSISRTGVGRFAKSG
jgi:L-2-aminoadipate reductase